MKKEEPVIEKVWTHFRYWGESYIVLPLTLAAFIGSLYLVNFLTGRPVIEQPDFVGLANSAVGIAIAASLTGLIQKFLFGYRSEKTLSPLLDDVHDSTVSIILFILCLYFLWN